MLNPTSKQLKAFKNLEDRLAKKSELYNNLRDKYQSPDGYDNWNKVLLSFAAFGEPEYKEVLKQAHEQDAGGPICAGMGAIVAAKLDAPAVYLTAELTEALARTDTTVENPPELVLPCFFICLPKGIIYAPQGASVTSILVYTSNPVGDLIPEFMDVAKQSTIRETVEKTKDLLYIAVRAGNDVFSAITGWNYEPGDQVDVHSAGVISDVERIVKNVILIYNYQKNLITTVRPAVTGTGFGKRQDRAVRSPLPTTILGQNFLVRRPQAVSHSGSSPTTTTTKRPHWRKGHWHTTVCGAGRKERRVKWFQPVYVNSSLDT